MRIEIPENVEYILNTLNNAGHEAYAVGGCVRDSLLHRTPGDWDITTSAKPLEVKDLFKVTIDTGLQHGTVTVVLNHENYEITTYRIDGEYMDGRHPESVEFTSSLYEDLRRRDFTINAMAYHPSTGIVDEFGGIDDLDNKIIKAVGEPSERFEEDALRMLRAVRFSAQLGFDIEEKTADAIKEKAGNLRKVSAERIAKELSLLISAKECGRIRKAAELGITKVVLPELDLCLDTPQHNPHHMYNVGEHCIHAMEYIPMGDKTKNPLRIAALLHDFGKPEVRTTDANGKDHFKGHAVRSEAIARNILRRLKFDNDTIAIVTKLVKYHDIFLDTTVDDMTHKYLRKVINMIGKDEMKLLFVIIEADIMSQSEYMRDEKVAELKRAKEVYDEIIAAGNAVELKDLAITGKDVISMGVPEGKAVGAMLAKLLDAVLDEPSLNNREDLLKLAEKWGGESEK